MVESMYVSVIKWKFFKLLGSFHRQTRKKVISGGREGPEKSHMLCSVALASSSCCFGRVSSQYLTLMR